MYSPHLCYLCLELKDLISSASGSIGISPKQLDNGGKILDEGSVVDRLAFVKVMISLERQSRLIKLQGKQTKQILGSGNSTRWLVVPGASNGASIHDQAQAFAPKVFASSPSVSVKSSNKFFCIR